MCGDTCVSDNECVSGFHCSLTLCVGDYTSGQMCVSANECQTNNCTDGVCCSVVECEECFSCARGGGVCGIVERNNDPRGEWCVCVCVCVYSQTNCLTNN